MDAVFVTDVSTVRYLSIDERIEAERERDALEDEVVCLAGHLNAANHRFLVLLGRLDRSHEWHDNPHACAQWLNLRCGISISTAREKVRVARALEVLPQISLAMGQGRLSYSKVRALTRVACPLTEEALLDMAVNSAASQVEKLVRQFRMAKETQELSRENRQQRNRHFSYHYGDDGSFIFKGSVPAEVGATLLKVLDAATEELPQFGTSAEIPETANLHLPMTIRRADAFAVLAQSFAAHGAMPVSGGDRNLISVRVAAETLIHNDAGCCEIEDGPAIAAETARRLACDASVISVIEDEDGEPLNVGRKTRTISAPLRRFLNARDRGCRFPGCSNTRWIDAHHIAHWANGGETKPSNLISLCSRHHRLVHEGRVQVEAMEGGAVRFVGPDGRRVEGAAPSPRDFKWTEIVTENEARGLDIDERTATSRGDPLDYELAVWVLCQRHARATATAAVSPAPMRP